MARPGGSTANQPKQPPQRRHLAVAVLAAALGVLVIGFSVGGGQALSLGTLVGVLFLAIAAVRLRLAQGG